MNVSNLIQTRVDDFAALTTPWMLWSVKASGVGSFGQEAPARDQQTAAALAKHQAAEIQKWWPIVKSTNLKPE